MPEDRGRKGGAVRQMAITAVLAGVGGLLVSFSLYGLGAIMTGGGHGTDLFIRVVFSPFLSFPGGEYSVLMAAALAFWSIVLFLAFTSVNPVCRSMCCTLLAAHYLGLLLLTRSDESYYVRKILASSEGMILVGAFAIIYLGMNGLVWWAMAKRWGTGNTDTV